MVYFDRCELKTVGRAGYTLQARNTADTYGYVFVDSKMTADASVAGHYIARTNRNEAVPAPHVALINCQLGNHISSDGWFIDGTPSDRSQIRFWEYQSTTESGDAADVRYRIPESRQLTATEAAEMRDVTRVLGGWNPK